MTRCSRRTQNGSDSLSCLHRFAQPGGDLLNAVVRCVGNWRKISRVRLHLDAVAYMAIVATVLFILACGANLNGQGLYQDELFQATGSFAYVGRPAVAAVTWYGLPVLNNSYVGAIKTAIYGMYLKATGRRFDVISWRLTGILLAGAGLFIFILITGRLLGVISVGAFVILVLTDAGVVLSSRHDYGPTALAFALRLILIALVVKSSLARSECFRYQLLMALVVGVSIFEKLSSVVLLCPLVIITVAQSRRSWRHWAVTIGGGLLGAAPLVALNVGSFLSNGAFISASDYVVNKPRSIQGFLTSAPMEFLALGTGSGIRNAVLGQSVVHSELVREIGCISAVIVVSVLISVACVRLCAQFQVAALMFASYVSVGVALYAIPRSTTFHHHVIVTPFHYAGVALVVAGIAEHWRVKGRALLARAGTFVLGAAIGLLILARLPAVVSIERDLLAGRSGPYWHPAFTELGRFAHDRRNEATFIAADWGVGAQMYCLSDASPNLVHEVFWSYHGPDDLARALMYSGRRAFYLVYPVRSFSGSEHPPYVAAIREDASRLPGWREVPLDDEARRLTPVIHIQKFVSMP